MAALSVITLPSGNTSVGICWSGLTRRNSSCAESGSHVDALEAVRGELIQDGANDLSLPPLDVISLIGVPLILLAVVLEEVHSFRQRRAGGRTRRRGPRFRMVG